MARTSPEEMAKTMIANLPEKTGKSLQQWRQLLEVNSPQKHGEIVKFLKAEHGVTHGFANLIAQQHLSAGDEAQDLLAAQYAGGKAGLRPIYDAVIKQVRHFGRDIDVAPKKTYVSLRRNKQFALLQPSTRDRLDIGINLPGAEPQGRLEASGSFNKMVSHRVRISDLAEIDKELTSWLREAYDAA